METTTFGIRRIQAAVLALVVGLALLGLAGEASATHQPSCGDIISHSVTLSADIGPCPGDGLVIGADNITLNLNGHTISGLSAAGAPLPQAAGTGAGILVQDHTGVTVTSGATNKGTVQFFDGGVVLVEGGGHTVSNLNVLDNVGVARDWGEGIGVWSSDGNTIAGNTVSRNGPYAGIGLYFHIVAEEIVGSSNNVVDNNVVADNNIFFSTTNQNIGIRVEHRSNNNKISNNQVSRSGLDGITIFPTADDNKVQDNTVRDNGNHALTHRKGDGIRVFGAAPSAPGDYNERTFVERNVACGNAGNGVYVGGLNAKVNSNRAGTGTNCPGNHAATVVSPTATIPYYELNDPTNCLTNMWKGNTTHPAGTPNHAYNDACTIAP